MTTSNTHSSVVPKLSQEPGTPANQWAKETEGAIDQHTSRGVLDADNSNVTSPGYELPGAFPMESTPSTTSANFGHSAKQSVEGAYSEAHNGIEGVYATAEHAARQYLPASVVDKLEGVGVLRENSESQGKASLPTQESESDFTPTHGGVGSLPGRNDEAGVAVLPLERGGEEVNKITDATAVTDTESHQSTYKTSSISTTTGTSLPTTAEFHDFDSFPTDPTDLLETPQTVNTANGKSDTNTCTSQQPDSSANTNSEGAHPDQKPSAPSNPIRGNGTLTSPDSDAQAAACVGRNGTGPVQGKGIPTSSEHGFQLDMDAESNVNGGRNKGTDTQTDGSPSSINVPREDSQTVETGDPPHAVGSDGKGRKEDIVIGNGRGGHTRKSSFVQKLKGEAKAFAEKVKTKTRG